MRGWWVVCLLLVSCMRAGDGTKVQPAAHHHRHHHRHHHHHSNKEQPEAHQQALTPTKKGVSVLEGDWGELGDEQPTTNIPPSNKQTANARQFKHATWRAIQTFGTQPPARTEHASTLVAGKYFVLFGGKASSGDLLNDLWVLDMSTLRWILLPVSQSPEPRVGHSLDVVGCTVVLFGGLGNGNKFLSDTRAVDFVCTEQNDSSACCLPNGGLKWRAIPLQSESPSRRQGHTTAVVGDFLYLLMGNQGPHSLNDMHVLHVPSARWCALQTTGIRVLPKDAARACAVPTLTKQYEIFLHGGGVTLKPQADLFRVQIAQSVDPDSCDSPITTRWEDVSGGDTPAIEAHTLVALDPSTIVAFGGFDGAKSLDTVFVYLVEHARWRVVQSIGEAPSPRCDHTAFVFKDEMFVFGGGDFEEGNDNDKTISGDLFAMRLD